MVTELGEERSREDLIGALCDLRSEMWNSVSACKALLECLHPAQRDSAINLIQYLAFRRNDLRPLQDSLSLLGLSSLGRAEAHVMASVDAVLTILFRLTNRSWEPDQQAPVSFSEAERLLSRHAEALLGQGEQPGTVRIMVTMPSEAATNYPFVRDLLAGGMDCMRINCAHDDPGAWVHMVKNLREAEQDVGRQCKVHMDLGGLKPRTGKISAGLAVLQARPHRDGRGFVTQPATVLLHPIGSDFSDGDRDMICLPVEASWFRGLQVGDIIRFEDARGADRRLDVTEVVEGRCMVALSKTAYFESGIVLWNCGPEGKRTDAFPGKIGEIPERPGFILLRPGDTLVIRGMPGPGTPAVVDTRGAILRPAEISCEPLEILKSVSVGNRIWLDDGKIGGKVQAACKDRIEVLITDVRERGRKLRSEKGINLPDSLVQLPALTDKDRQDLLIVVRYADTVGLSFAKSAQDVFDLQESIRQTGEKRPGIILKIETKAALQELPRLLFAAMRSPNIGVMIARGDLAVECGYERLAEAQEEILWICEAAHVPVVWATQVLDHLAKEGIPSRAEISDAVMAQRAECVMLNKGLFILPAIKVLRDIFKRMDAHQDKKRARLRALQIARRFSP